MDLVIYTTRMRNFMERDVKMEDSFYEKIHLPNFVSLTFQVISNRSKLNLEKLCIYVLRSF